MQLLSKNAILKLSFHQINLHVYSWREKFIKFSWLIKSFSIKKWSSLGFNWQLNKWSFRFEGCNGLPITLPYKTGRCKPFTHFDRRGSTATVLCMFWSSNFGLQKAVSQKAVSHSGRMPISICERIAKVQTFWNRKQYEVNSSLKLPSSLLDHQNLMKMLTNVWGAFLEEDLFCVLLQNFCNSP